MERLSPTRLSPTRLPSKRPAPQRLAPLLLGFFAACNDGSSSAAPSDRTASAPATTSAADAAPAAALESSTVVPPPPPPPGPCGSDMVLVAGNYCPAVQQLCAERPPTIGGSGKHHCKRYKPARCLSSRKPLRFCMDRYEWPNEKGVKPRMLTTWMEARDMCKAAGKRLCTTDEFNFACEGESMKPHVYGLQRSDTTCNMDKPYIERTYAYKRWDECMALPACKREFERLDQRLPAGSKPECVSDDGVYDLNGNANEWVYRTDQKHPNRSGLKGGWWGPVRNRCRPMTVFHMEGDWGYEVGFRCCKDPPAP